MRGFRGLVLAVLLVAPAAYSETYLILPFFNVSNSNNIAWVGDSISGTIVESLAGEGLLTIRRDALEDAFKRMGVRPAARLTEASVLEIAINVDAANALSGEFDLLPATTPSSRGRLRIRARLVDIRHMRRVAQFEENGPLEELSALQAELAWKVLRAIRPNSLITVDDFRRAHPPVRLDALESYVRGLLSTTSEQKLRLFANAARLEPSFTQSAFELGRLHFSRRDYRSACDWYAKVAPTLAEYREAQFFLALSRFHLGQYEAARQGFVALLEQAPLSEVFNNLGATQIRLGDPGALASFEKAIEAAPADPVVRFNTGYVLWRKGDFAAAAAQFKAALERDPDDEQAQMLLERCEQQSAFQQSDPRTERLERLKNNYDDSAWLNLKQMLDPAKRERD
jgi:tetratricopeptide (TPR) repeat protein